MLQMISQNWPLVAAAAVPHCQRCRGHMQRQPRGAELLRMSLSRNSHVRPPPRRHAVTLYRVE